MNIYLETVFLKYHIILSDVIKLMSWRLQLTETYILFYVGGGLVYWA